MEANSYLSTIKLEFKELVDNITYSTRGSFHLYTIHRILSLGLLIDFTFTYRQADNPQQEICIEMDLGEKRNVQFIVDIDSEYVRLAGEEDIATLKQFLEVFDTSVRKKGRKHKLF